MKDAQIKQNKKNIPTTPGVYFFKNKKGEILYIGKAKNLKKRIQSHFSSKKHWAQFYSQIDSIDTIETQTEKDAFILELSLIKKYRPRYNSELKDDKDYSYVVIPSRETKKVYITHQKKTAADMYVGPFISAKELKLFLSAMRKLFPFKMCSNPPSKKCLYYDMGLCWAHSEKLQFYPTIIQGLRACVQLYNNEPVRIECYDISHTQGSSSVGSMVSFLGDTPHKKMYRTFIIKNSPKGDDPRALSEIISRRFSHPEWTLPDLIIIDGGKSQLSQFKNFPIPVVGLAKYDRERERATLYTPFSSAPVSLHALPQSFKTPLLFLRDEAHRFAITFHRKKRVSSLIQTKKRT